jgi:hypothetical protein
VKPGSTATAVGRPRRSGVKGESQEVMGDLIYLLIVAAFFALSIGYARIAPRL